MPIRCSPLKPCIHLRFLSRLARQVRSSAYDCLERSSQPSWYPAKQGQPTKRPLLTEAAPARVRAIPSPWDLADPLACCRVRLQFAIDDVVDERHVVHDGEMRALSDVHLQTR